MTIIDPKTGRAAYIGPNGEAALAPGDSRIATMGARPYTMPDGRVAYYVPNVNTSAANRALLSQYSQPTSSGGGGGSPVAPAPTAGGGSTQLIDPSTGRAAVTGPLGEAGLAAGDPRISTMAGLASWTMPDGRIAYYLPGQNISEGNKMALEAWKKANGEDEDEDMGNASAHALIRQTLERYGLGELSDWAWSQLQNGRSYEEILLELREQPVFKSRFKAIDIRRANGLNAVSPETIIEYENTARDLMRQSGLPSGFYDQFDDFAQLIGKGVSLQSVARRVEQSWDRVVNAPEAVRQAFGDLYGIRGDQALAALMFDPDKAEQKLEDMARSAVAGGAMRAAGFDMDAITAGRLAGFDFEDQTVRAGFARLAQLRAVFTETMGERNEQDLDAMREGVNSVFDIGQGAEAMERRVQTRINEFAGGGGAYATNEGLTGLRSY